MQVQFRALLHMIENIPDEPPTNLLKAQRGLPPVGTLPLSRATWLLLALFVYRQRQQWAKQFVREHRPEAIPPSARIRRMCDEDPPVEMNLQGAPEWEVTLECGYGYGTMFHRTTKELITFGLTQKDREAILYPRMFRDILKPASRWEPAGRALEVNFSDDEIWRSIDDLVAVRILEPLGDDALLSRHWLVGEDHRLNRHMCAECADSILRFCEQWKDPDHRLWLASVIGDWALAHELAQVKGDAKLVAFTGERAEESRLLETETAARIEQACRWAFTAPPSVQCAE
jgi:hypothetical protein